MFKKILGVFGINKRKDSLRSNPKEEGKNALEQEVGKAIDEIKPAHLAYSFKYTYTTWGALKSMTWGTAKQYTWAEIKIYEGDD